MTANDQWLCQVTNDLSSAIVEPSRRQNIEGENAHLSWSIPGIVLHVAGTPAAAIGIHQEPDRTLSLSSPVFFDDRLSDVTYARMLERLLATVNAEATAMNCTRIRYLLSATESSDMPWIQHILQRSGFSIGAQITPWTFTAASSTASASRVSIPSEPEILDGPLGRYEILAAASIQPTTDRFQTLSSLLRSILSDSDDLSRMPPAEAEGLLNEWLTENALIVLVHRAQVAVSICVCVFPTESVSANIVDLQLRYLGVHPTFRRMSIAKDLLAELPSILKSSFPLPAENVRLTAFSDLSNKAATALYAACGFARGELSAIWQRSLEQL